MSKTYVMTFRRGRFPPVIHRAVKTQWGFEVACGFDPGRNFKVLSAPQQVTCPLCMRLPVDPIRPEPAKLTFNSALAEEQKQEGMEAAATSRSEILDMAREFAVQIARSRANRCVTADDVQRRLIESGYTPDQLGPAAGSIFRVEGWIWTGEWVASERVSNHKRMLRVWKLR